MAQGIIDPFYSYASRHLVYGSYHDRAPQPPNTCIISTFNKWENPGLEFDVRLDVITSASPYIARKMHPDYPICMLEEENNHIQLFLKYLDKGLYDPTELSVRCAEKQFILLAQLEFYLFCVRMECTALCNMVRVGVQSGLDVMAWSPLPTREDVCSFTSPKGTGTTIVYYFEMAASKYQKIPRDDPLRKTLLRYLNNLWRVYGPMFKPDMVDMYMEETYKELWIDLKVFKRGVPVDFYESQAPERPSPSSGWVNSYMPSVLKNLWG